MADVPVPSIVTATPAAADTVLGVQGGAVKRFNASALAALAPFTQTGAGAVARTAQDKLRETVSVRDFGAVGNGAANDTASIQAAIDAVYGAGGGTVYFPPGIYMVSSLSRNWSEKVSVNFVGSGKKSTVIQKIGGTSTPVLDLSADIGVLETYSNISNLSIVGASKSSHGIVLTRNARFSIENVSVSACDVGIENVGGLVFTAYDVTLQANAIGYRSRKSATTKPNLIEVFGGQISGNTTLGMDIGDAGSLHVHCTDVSANGTAADLATGGVVIRSTVDDETGYANIVFSGCWFEANKGMAFRADAATGLQLAIRNANFFSSESGNAIALSTIRHALLENVIASGTGDTVTLAATNSTVVGGVIYTLADSSTQRTHVNVSGAGEPTRLRTNRLQIEGAAGTDMRVIPGGALGYTDSDTALFKSAGIGEIIIRVGATEGVAVSQTGIGFFGNSPIAKPVVSGSRGDNVALASLLSVLASYGLITNSSSA